MIRGAKRSQRCSMPMGAAMHAFFGIRRFQQAITLCAWRSPAPCNQSRHTLLATTWHSILHSVSVSLYLRPQTRHTPPAHSASQCTNALRPAD